MRWRCHGGGHRNGPFEVVLLTISFGLSSRPQLRPSSISMYCLVSSFLPLMTLRNLWTHRRRIPTLSLLLEDPPTPRLVSLRQVAHWGGFPPGLA